jgi:hypothetical protein
MKCFSVPHISILVEITKPVILLAVHLIQYCAGGKMETNEMGRACGAYRGGERCAQGVGGEA